MHALMVRHKRRSGNHMPCINPYSNFKSFEKFCKVSVAKLFASVRAKQPDQARQN